MSHNLSRIQFKRGANSLYAVTKKYFLKLLYTPSEIHNLYISGKFNKIKFTPSFVEYREVPRSDLKVLTEKTDIDRAILTLNKAHLYIFRTEHITRIDYFLERRKLEKQFLREIIISTLYVFNRLHSYEYTYHDLCWDNLVLNSKTQKPMIIDLDAATNHHNLYKSSKLQGQKTYHQLFLSLRKNNYPRLETMEYLGSCLVTNLFYALAVAYFTERYELIPAYAREIPKILIDKKNPNNISFLKKPLQNEKLLDVLNKATEYLNQVLKSEQRGHLNNLISLAMTLPKV